MLTTAVKITEEEGIGWTNRLIRLRVSWRSQR
jgi:hypothetical protein